MFISIHNESNVSTVLSLYRKSRAYHLPHIKASLATDDIVLLPVCLKSNALLHASLSALSSILNLNQKS